MRIAWAFNPFDDDAALLRAGAALCTALGEADAGPELVYVASPAEPRLTTAFQVPPAERFSGLPRRRIETMARRLRLQGATVTVLRERSPSLSNAARALVAHLARAKPLTALATHARRGLPRVLLGSFAETVVHLAQSDLVLFDRACRLSRPPRALLFAHDLSPAGARGLRAAIRYASTWGCALHVAHVAEPAIGFSRRAADVEALRAGLRGEMARCQARLARAGLAGTAVLLAGGEPAVEQLVAQLGRTRADLLVVAARRGRLAGLIGGSVTRRLLRRAPAPVLILRP